MTLIQLAQFDGGRFYRNRQVYQIIIELPDIGEYFRDDLTPSGLSTCASILRGGIGEPTFRRERLSKLKERVVYTYRTETPDPTLILLCGKTLRQLFNAQMHRHSLSAVDRGNRAGKWWGETKLMPMHFLPRSHVWNKFGRISKEYEEWFAPYFGDPFDRPEIDCGPKRKPPLWQCNLCWHSALWSDWPISDTPGLSSSNYICECPNCGAKRGDTFHEIVHAGEPGPKFRPEARMQDDWVFEVGGY